MKKLLVLLALPLLATTAVALAIEEGWKPWQFKTNEVYELRVMDHNGRDAKPTHFVLDIAPGEGEGMVQVSYTTRTQMKASELGAQTAFGGMASGMGAGLAMMINPMAMGFMEQLDLAVGEKMALFGAGHIEVTGKETIAGVEGFVCKMFGPKNQDSPLQSEWVVNPDLAIPLRSVTYNRGKKGFEVELVRYESR